jgi:hypothetical protein
VVVDASGTEATDTSAVSGRPYRYSAYLHDAVLADGLYWDAYSVPATTTVRAGTITALTTGSKTIAYGAAFGIGGTLMSSGVGLSGQSVILQSAAPGGAYTDKSPVGTTGAGGVFSFSVKPRNKTYYRVRFAGSTGYAPSGPTSPVYATPKTSVSNPVAPKTMRSSRYYSVYGYLKPRHTSGTYPVRIYKYRRVGRRWKSYGSVKARASNYKSYTKYAKKLKLTTRGTWRLRACAPLDSRHAKTWSKGYDYVTVK